MNVRATSDAPEVSVVMPTHDRRDSVRRALGALADQSVEAHRFEVIVVVDGSTDGTWELLESLSPAYRLGAVRSSGRGRAAACNAGIERASSHLVALLDDDMEPSPGWLAGHLAAHAGRPGLGVLGASPGPTDEQAPAAGRYLLRRFERHLAKLARGDAPIGFRDVYTGNFSIARDHLVAVGGFDEGFRAYGNEDGELAIRLIDAGISFTYDERALAIQHQDKDLRAAFSDAVAKGTTAVLLARRHPEAAASLRLGRRGSRRRRLVRRGLMGLTTWVPPLPRALISVVGLLERLDLAGLDPVYDVLLDLGYWLGVEASRATPDPASLDTGSRGYRRGALSKPRSSRRQRLRRIRRPAFLGTLRRTTPLSDRWGSDRGTPIDRVYIEAFLADHAGDIRGRVLEVGDARYVTRFGHDLERIDILDVDASNPEATIVADLARPGSLPIARFDCLVVTQVLQYVPDTETAIRELHRALAPGGTALLTVPATSRIGRRDLGSDLWRFTPAALERLFGAVFGPDRVTVHGYGSVLTAIAFLAGMAAEELTERELRVVDPSFPVIVAVRATVAPDEPAD